MLIKNLIKNLTTCSSASEAKAEAEVKTDEFPETPSTEWFKNANIKYGNIAKTNIPTVLCSILPKHWRCNRALPNDFKVIVLGEIPDGTLVKIKCYNDENIYGKILNNEAKIKNHIAEFSDLRFVGRSGRGKLFTLSICIETSPEKIALYKDAIKITVDGPRNPRIRGYPRISYPNNVMLPHFLQPQVIPPGYGYLHPGTYDTLLLNSASLDKINICKVNSYADDFRHYAPAYHPLLTLRPAGGPIAPTDVQTNYRHIRLAPSQVLPQVPNPPTKVTTNPWLHPHAFHPYNYSSTLPSLHSNYKELPRSDSDTQLNSQSSPSSASYSMPVACQTSMPVAYQTSIDSNITEERDTRTLSLGSLAQQNSLPASSSISMAAAYQTSMPYIKTSVISNSVHEKSIPNSDSDEYIKPLNSTVNTQSLNLGSSEDNLHQSVDRAQQSSLSIPRSRCELKAPSAMKHLYHQSCAPQFNNPKHTTAARFDENASQKIFWRPF